MDHEQSYDVDDGWRGLRATGDPGFSSQQADHRDYAGNGKICRSAERLPPETISGKITMVVPDRKLMVVVSPDGVPYDVVVNGATRIKSGSRSVTLQGLEQYQNKNVTIKFIPERRGDVAESI